jgi:hypothetical protein
MQTTQHTTNRKSQEALTELRLEIAGLRNEIKLLSGTVTSIAIAAVVVILVVSLTTALT